MPVAVRTQALRLLVASGAAGLAQCPSARASALDGWTLALEGYDIAARCCGPAGEGAIHEAAWKLLCEALDANPKVPEVLVEFRALAQGLQTAVIANRVGSECDDVMSYTYGYSVPILDRFQRDIEARVAAVHAARGAAAQAARGRAQVARLEIAGIARTIQTISINARIEAARAGAAGRSFDLIASEIRTLSERSTDASAAMARSIDEILGHAEAGGEAGAGEPGA